MMARRIVSAALWIAAFSFAAGVFLSVTLLFRILPPTKPVAIGFVTFVGASKLRDYLGLALFLVGVPPLTIWFRRLADRFTKDLDTTAALLFAGPYLLAPFFYLTTGKAGWILFLPIALSFAAVHALRLARTRSWLRRMFADDLAPYHALLFCEALSWILFRYLVTGKRIAHIPTLFLEIVFVALFLSLFWGAAFLAVRVAELTLAIDPATTFRKITTGALPLVLLPILGTLFVPTPQPGWLVIVLLLVSALIALRARPLAPKTARSLAAYAILPLLIYIVSYASTAELSQWIDLFHRGESIGPASDYLRGKVAFRDVFALHGMLEDGFLDAQLMTIFGRDVEVAVTRTVVIGAFLGVALWFLGLVLFDSIPLALLVVTIGAWTTTENNRTVFQVAAVALFLHALQKNRRLSAVLAGVLAAFSLFFSYEIGLYTIAGAVASTIVVLWSRRRPGGGVPPRAAAPPLGSFLIGVMVGAAPFVIYLAVNNALDDYFVTSFITIPRIIDAVWSLPFPDLVSPFRSNLNVRVLADFVVQEKFHLILSPLTIAVAVIYCIARWLRRRMTQLDEALLVLAVFAAIAQRTAFGRAEFRHQYFAAFLIGPMLVLLALAFVRMLRRIWSEGTDRAFVAAVVAVLIPVTAIVFWVPDILNWRIDDFSRYQARVQQQIREPHAEAVRERIRTVVEEIDAVVKKNAPIYDFSNQPAFYFFANRPNPTRFYQVPIASPRELQAEVIRDLERAKPEMVIRTSPEGFDNFDAIPNTLRAQAIAAYLDDCYRFHSSQRGVELWRRVRGVRAAPVAQYLRRIRMPHKDEMATAGNARMVFPIAGSLPGANGAYWVSDLMLYNPLRVPITATLRFVGGNHRVDRRVTLAPRQTLRWPDMTKSLFKLGDAIGVLWITYTNNRAPVAVLRTYDATRDAEPSVETPLTDGDAVTAGGDVSELAVVGIPLRREGRRVNVGVVNTGIVPAHFAIEVRNSRGTTLGRRIENAFHEREVWFVNDVERELGVSLSDDTTIRITALGGSGVGFATVVAPDGGTQFIPAIPSQQ